MNVQRDNDAGSRQIFEGLVADEERHYSQYDDEVLKIEKFGESLSGSAIHARQHGAAEGEATKTII